MPHDTPTTAVIQPAYRHADIALSDDPLCPNGEPWNPNPDGIRPGEERGPRMSQETGMWEDVADEATKSASAHDGDHTAKRECSGGHDADQP